MCVIPVLMRNSNAFWRETRRERERARMAESELLTTSAASPDKLCKMSYPLLTTSWTLFSYLIRRKFYSNFKSCLIALFSRIWEKRLDITVSVSYWFYLYTEHNLYLLPYLNTSRYFKFVCNNSRSTRIQNILFTRLVLGSYTNHFGYTWHRPTGKLQTF